MNVSSLNNIHIIYAYDKISPVFLFIAQSRYLLGISFNKSAVAILNHAFDIKNAIWWNQNRSRELLTKQKTIYSIYIYIW